MKESVYAFYPPAKDVWKTYREQPDSYIKECLYRHRNTRFSSNPTVRANAQLTASATGNSEQNASAASPSYQPSRTDDAVVNTREHVDDEVVQDDKTVKNVDQRRSRSASGLKKDRKWTERLAETTYTEYAGLPVSLSRSHSTRQQQSVNSNGFSGLKDDAGQVAVGTEQEQPNSVTSGVQPRQKQDTQTTRPVTATAKQPIICHRRVDATENESKFKPEIRTSPLRDGGDLVSDAGGGFGSTGPRPPSPATVKRSKSAMPSCGRSGSIDTSRQRRMIKSAAVGIRPAVQLAAEPVANSTIPQPCLAASLPPSSNEVNVGVENPIDYDQQLKKYGWRMEIPGDPFHIKRQCIPKRRPTTVTCAIPVVLPSPPKFVGLDSCETFFHGTLPRNPMSFTVHPDWTSEVIVTRRIELQKRDSAAMAAAAGSTSSDADRRWTRSAYPYCTRNFSFIY